MAIKQKVPCPKCDAKGVIPQYFYNRKGICFLCWGDKYIYIKVPAGKTKEEAHADLVKKEKPDFKKNPPKVAMPDHKQIKNPKYFPKANSKVDIKARAENPNDNVKNLKDRLAHYKSSVSGMYDNEIANQMELYSGSVIKKQENPEAAKVMKEIHKVFHDEAVKRELAEKDARDKVNPTTTYSYDGKGGYTFMSVGDKVTLSDGKKGEIVATKHYMKKIGVKLEDGTPASYPVGQVTKVEKPSDKPVEKPVEKPAGKPKATRPDKVEEGETDKFKIFSRVHTQTGEKFYTVEPKERMSKEEFLKFSAEMKKSGGFYDRFLKTMRFKEEPTEALKAFEAGGAVPATTGDTPKEDEPKTLSTYESREIRRKVTDLIDEQMAKDTNDIAAWEALKERIKNDFPEYRHKDSDYDTIDLYISMAKVAEKEAAENARRAAERQKEAEVQKQIDNIKRTYGGIDNRSLDILQRMQKSAETLDDGQAKTTFLRQLQEKIDEAEGKSGVHLEMRLAKEKYDADMKTREELIKRNTADEIKTDNPLGLAVKELLSKGPVTPEVTREVGKLISAEIEAQESQQTKDLRADLVRVTGERGQHYQNYLNETDRWKKGEHGAKYNETLKEQEEIRAKLAKQQSKAYKAAMSKVREMGDDVALNVSNNKDNSAGAIKKVDKVKGYLPKTWMEISNTRPMDFLTHRKNKTNQGREYHRSNEHPPSLTPAYVNGKLVREVTEHNSSINLYAKTEDSVTLHEMMHRMEWANPNIHNLEEDFYQERVDIAKAPVHLGAGYRKSETYRPQKSGDAWYNNYMGKDYARKQPDGSEKRRTFEIMTMGIQEVVFGDNQRAGVSLKEHDEEYYNFILGVIASA